MKEKSENDNSFVMLANGFVVFQTIVVTLMALMGGDHSDDWYLLPLIITAAFFFGALPKNDKTAWRSVMVVLGLALTAGLLLIASQQGTQNSSWLYPTVVTLVASYFTGRNDE